jgi:hypothetical protein
MEVHRLQDGPHIVAFISVPFYKTRSQANHRLLQFTCHVEANFPCNGMCNIEIGGN